MPSSLGNVSRIQIQIQIRRARQPQPDLSPPVMDSDTPNLNTSDFSEKDKKDLQTFIENEHSKAKFQSNVHNLTDMCWTKCITGRITNTTIDRSEGSCLENCVNRFIDSQKTIVKQLDVLGGRV